MGGKTRLEERSRGFAGQSFSEDLLHVKHHRGQTVKGHQNAEAALVPSWLWTQKKSCRLDCDIDSIDRELQLGCLEKLTDC